MARQESIILLKGPVGNLSFYKMDGEYFARKKSGVSAERIKNEPAYARTRENIAEFGRASLSTKLFRKTLRPFIRTMADPRVTGRLTAAMLRVIKSDDVNSRGQRRVSDGETALLKGFEFNRNCKLQEAFKAPYTASIDRTTGTMTIDIPSFVPEEKLSIPPGATHFRLTARGAAIDFDGDHYSASTCQSDDIPITTTPHESLKLSLTVSASQHPMFLILGIEFMQRIKNGTYGSLNGSNAMAIVKVEDGTVGEALPNMARRGIKQAPALTKKSVAIQRRLILSHRPIPNREPIASAGNDDDSIKPPSFIVSVRARDR